MAENNKQDINPQEENNESSKELKIYMVKAIESYSLKHDIIKRHRAVTVTALENLLDKVQLDTKVLLKVDWEKGLASQKEEVLKAIYEKIDYKPTSPRELALEYTLEISKKLKKGLNITQVSLNTLIEYAAANNVDANKYKEWTFGLNGTNTLVNQDTSFLSKKVGA